MKRIKLTHGSAHVSDKVSHTLTDALNELSEMAFKNADDLIHNEMKREYLKLTSKGKTHIVEGEKKPGNVYSVHRFICEVQIQETEKETQEIADMLVQALSKLK